MNRRQRFSPHPSGNMLVETATISGVSPKNSTARRPRDLAAVNTPRSAGKPKHVVDPAHER